MDSVRNAIITTPILSQNESQNGRTTATPKWLQFSVKTLCLYPPSIRRQNGRAS